MKFKEFFGKLYANIKAFALKNKIAAGVIAMAILAVIVLVIVLIVNACKGPKKPNYVAYDSDGKGYTQEEFDAVASWWESGDVTIGQEGDIDLEK